MVLRPCLYTTPIIEQIRKTWSSFNYNQTSYDSVHNLVYFHCFVYAFLCLQRVFPRNNVTHSLCPKHFLIRHETLGHSPMFHVNLLSKCCC